MLSILVEQYEDEHHPIEEVSDRELLEHLIEARGTSQRQVAREAGIAVSTMSELVAGKRPINLTHIKKLAPYFGVEPGIFIGQKASTARTRRSPQPSTTITA